MAQGQGRHRGREHTLWGERVHWWLALRIEYVRESWRTTPTHNERDSLNDSPCLTVMPKKTY